MFNLANQYAKSGLYTEALSTFQQLTKNRSFNNVGRLRLNIANLHFNLGQYSLALKQYRMALDQVPVHFITLRYVSISVLSSNIANSLLFLMVMRSTLINQSYLGCFDQDKNHAEYWATLH